MMRRYDWGWNEMRIGGGNSLITEGWKRWRTTNQVGRNLLAWIDYLEGANFTRALFKFFPLGHAGIEYEVTQSME